MTGWRGRCVLLAACLIALGRVEAVEAQGRSLLIESFDVTLTVGENGRTSVVEAIRFRFNGSWNGVYRLIPVDYTSDRGFNYRLLLDVESITDESGRPLKYKDTREGHYRKLKVWVPGAQNTSKTVFFRYSSPNALRFFDTRDARFAQGHDELYWNATGDEWNLSILRASVTVNLPPAATGARARSFTGRYGSTTTTATLEELESGFYFATTGFLAPHEGLTVVVGWDPGVVDRPGAFTKAWMFLRSNLIFLLPIVTLFGMWRLWLAKGRDPSRLPVAPQYKPPEDLAPAEIGTLIDNRVDMRDVTAGIVNLAVRGFLRIEERERTGLASIFGGTDYAFIMLKDADTWDELLPHEGTLLRGLFSNGHRQEVEMDDLENEFYKDLRKVRDGVYARLVALGYYDHRPDQVQAGYIGGGIVLVVLMIIGTAVLGNHMAIRPEHILVAGLLTVVPVFGFGFFMPARTVKGARQLEQVLGFQEFLNRVEADHFRRMIDSPEMFERYLPHAMALGVERKWAKAFDDIYKEPPDWYRSTSGRGFRPTVFVGDLGSMSTRAGAVMASQPRSSGGSGFGGGGGGGGFGGGGGGGF